MMSDKVEHYRLLLAMPDRFDARRAHRVTQPGDPRRQLTVKRRLALAWLHHRMEAARPTDTADSACRVTRLRRLG